MISTCFLARKNKSQTFEKHHVFLFHGEGWYTAAQRANNKGHGVSFLVQPSNTLCRVCPWSLGHPGEYPTTAGFLLVCWHACDHHIHNNMSPCLQLPVCVCYSESTYLAEWAAMLAPGSCRVQRYWCGGVGGRFFASPIVRVCLRTAVSSRVFHLTNKRGEFLGFFGFQQQRPGYFGRVEQ